MNPSLHSPAAIRELAILPEFDRRVRELFVDAVYDWTPSRQAVRRVFWACPTNALTREQVATIAAALCGMPVDVAKGLQFFVRLGVLRRCKDRYEAAI